jgi:hypothetical protein
VGAGVCAAECSNCKRTNPRAPERWNRQNGDVAKFETPPFLGTGYTINFHLSVCNGRPGSTCAKHSLNDSKGAPGSDFELGLGLPPGASTKKSSSSMWIRSDITEAATLNRAAFYAHYPDKVALLGRVCPCQFSASSGAETCAL